MASGRNTEECEACGSDERLVDVVINGQLTKLCLSCAETSESVILAKPTTTQLTEAERPYTAKERLLKISGVDELLEEVSATSVKPAAAESKITTEIKKEDKKEAKPEKKEETKEVEEVTPAQKLIKLRQQKGLTQGQLAEALAESEEGISRAEKGEFINENLKTKLEQFFQTKFDEKAREIPKFIDFHSDSVTIGDLRRMREAKKEEKEQQEK